MGEGTAQAVEEIEQVRERLDTEIGVLQERMPMVAARARRVAAWVVGAGVASTFVLVLIRRRRRE